MKSINIKNILVASLIIMQVYSYSYVIPDYSFKVRALQRIALNSQHLNRVKDSFNKLSKEDEYSELYYGLKFFI